MDNRCSEVRKGEDYRDIMMDVISLRCVWFYGVVGRYLWGNGENGHNYVTLENCIQNLKRPD